MIVQTLMYRDPGGRNAEFVTAVKFAPLELAVWVRDPEISAFWREERPPHYQRRLGLL